MVYAILFCGHCGHEFYKTRITGQVTTYNLVATVQDTPICPQCGNSDPTLKIVVEPPSRAIVEQDLPDWTRGPDEVLGEVEGEQWCQICGRHRPHSHFPHKEIVEGQVEQQEPTEPCYVCEQPVGYVEQGNGEEAVIPVCAYCDRVVCPAHSFPDGTGYLCCIDPKCRGEDITDAQAEQIKAAEDATEQHLEQTEADLFEDCGY